jgi:hypothetical protein
MVDTTKDLENDLCHCGRYAWKCHCPHCGSYHNYAVKQRDTVAGRVLVVHQCRHCGAKFNDDDWMLRCEAPHALLSTRGRKPKLEPTPQFENLNDIPEVYRNGLEALKKKRGI